MILYFEAFLIGLMGSFHCIGMCGPIALALPVGDGLLYQRLIRSIAYNFGRILMYAFIGLIIGFFAKGLTFWGLQRWASIIMGVVMILSVLISLIYSPIHIQKFSRWWNYLFQKPFAFLMKQNGIAALFLIGLINGLLPCGLVYLALAGAVVSEHHFQGALFMFFFGLGTFPIMFSLVFAKSYISNNLRSRIQKFMPWFIIVIGLLFILRGLNLGIPYLSPKMEKPGCAKCCHA